MESEAIPPNADNDENFGFPADDFKRKGGAWRFALARHDGLPQITFWQEAQIPNRFDFGVGIQIIGNDFGIAIGTLHAQL